jgi:hypothetical protein
MPFWTFSRFLRYEAGFITKMENNSPRQSLSIGVSPASTRHFIAFVKSFEGKSTRSPVGSASRC